MKQEQKVVIRGVCDVVIKHILLWVTCINIWFFIIISFGNHFKIGFDDTDGDTRSNMVIRVDNLTKCQYLQGSGGGLTPRLDTRGKHICKERP